MNDSGGDDRIAEGSIAHMWLKTWKLHVAFVFGVVAGNVACLILEPLWAEFVALMLVLAPYLALCDYWYQKGTREMDDRERRSDWEKQ